MNRQAKIIRIKVIDSPIRMIPIRSTSSISVDPDELTERTGWCCKSVHHSTTQFVDSKEINNEPLKQYNW